MQGWFELTVNGVLHRVEGVSCQTTLFEYLRESGIARLGTPRGLDHCGPDSVILLDLSAKGQPAYRLISSALMPLPLAAGRTILTAEALCQGETPHPVVGILRKHAPLLADEARHPLLLALFEAWYRDGLESVEQVVDAYEGMSFRFGAFRNLRRAAVELFDRVALIRSRNMASFESGTPEAFASLRSRGLKAASDPFGDAFSTALHAPAALPPSLHYVDAHGCRFYRPATVIEFEKLGAEYPESVIVHSGVNLLRGDRAKSDAKCFISTESIPEPKLTYAQDGRLEIGAGSTLSVIQELLEPLFPSLAQLAARLEPRPVRNRLTLTEHIFAERQPPSLAVPFFLGDAQVRLISSEGERDVPIAGFFRTRAESGPRHKELVKSLILPHPARENDSYRFQRTYVFGSGRTQPRVLAAAGFAITLNAQNQIAEARAAFAGLEQGHPVRRAEKLEAALVGKPWSEKLGDELDEAVSECLELRTDAELSEPVREAMADNAWKRFCRDFRHQAVAEDQKPISLPPPSQMVPAPASAPAPAPVQIEQIPEHRPPVPLRPAPEPSRATPLQPQLVRPPDPKPTLEIRPLRPVAKTPQPIIPDTPKTPIPTPPPAPATPPPTATEEPPPTEEQPKPAPPRPMPITFRPKTS